MILVFSIAFCVTALLAAFVFHSAMIPCLLAALVSAGLGAAELLVFRKNPKLRAAGILGCIMLAGVSVLTPAAATDFGVNDFSDKYSDYAALMLRDQYEKAEPLRQEVEEKYGMTDGIRYMEGMAAIAAEDVNKAEEYANSFTDKTDLSYFTLQEEVCRLRYPDKDDRAKALHSLYQDAVKCHPDWSYALKQLGILLFYEKSYDSARYYLISASENKDEEDGEILYYLGASFIEQGDNEKGLQLLYEADSYDLDETYKQGILWYANQAGLGGEQ